ncbi:unnamed protein product [Candidula unifasciata]|uniref:ADP-ribosylation factor-like protein 13B n=1 Tax=Candidula unifasciata TaxID=100452 RepID=A0A8S3ZN37_9EUPU|nr:unnamed protein product [Candidula unifasciata]
MGNCISAVKRRKQPNKAITLAIVGLDNAGKTTLCHVLTGEPLDPDPAPTVGFRNVRFSHSHFDVTAFDLGGGEGIRPIWKTYFGEVFALIYVIDSSTPSRLSEASDMFMDTLKHPQVSGKPVLIVANKVDKEEHMKEADIVSGLNLKNTIIVTSCPSKLVMASALKGVGTKMDREIQRGVDWLFDKIQESLSALEPRIEADMKAAKEAREKEREERKARVKMQREEREKAEEMERTQLGISKKPDSDDEDIIIGDPFKALDIEKLKEKELKLKEEKLQKQEKINNLANKEKGNKHSDSAEVKDSNRDSLKTMNISENVNLGMSGDRTLHLEDVDASTVFGRSPRASALPPLEPIEFRSESNLPENSKTKRRKKKKLTAYHLQPHNIQSQANEVNESKSAPELTSRAVDLSGSQTHFNGQISMNDKPKKLKTVAAGKINQNEEENNLYKSPKFESLKHMSNGDGHTFSKRKMSSDMHSTFDAVSQESVDFDSHQPQKTNNQNSKHTGKNGEDIVDKTSELGSATSAENIQRPNKEKLRKSERGTEKMKNSLSNLLSDEENNSYASDSLLKETLRSPLSPTYVESLRDSSIEMSNLQMSRSVGSFNQRIAQGGVENGGFTGQMSEKNKNDNDDVSELGKSASSSLHSPERGEEKSNPRRKKKRNFLRSNRVAPSDDENTKPGPEEVNLSSHVVQEHGSMSLPDTSTPVKNRNTMVTSHYTNFVHEPDFNSNWGLAEDLPAVDNDALRVPNFDSNDDDIIT